MRKKLGRNAPCHCGSGKKYKKCCIVRDKNKAKLEQSPDLLYEDVKEEEIEEGHADDCEEIYEDSTQAENEFSPPNIERKKKPKVPPLSDLNEKEQQIVDDWGSKYVTQKEPDELLTHIKQFLQQHPTLVPYLGLEEEALFELEALLLRHHRGDEYIEVLLEIRESFPNMYVQRYAYYDSSVIVYYIGQGETEKAAQFMGNFTKYPDDDPDVLFPLINFLCVSNQKNLLAEFLAEIYLDVLYSKNIMRAGSIIDPLLWACHYVPLLENGYDEHSMLALSTTLKTLNIDFKDDYYKAEFLLDEFNQITETIEEPLEEKYKATKNAMVFYHQIGMNYIGWLHKEKNVPWLTAYYYHTLIIKYFHTSIPAKKRPKKPFVFIHSHVDKTLLQMSRGFFSLSATTSLSSFRALYGFADYLLAHQAISEKDAQELQGWCKTFNKKLLPGLLQKQFEAQYFTIPSPLSIMDLP
jgi:hypothetical protein